MFSALKAIYFLFLNDYTWPFVCFGWTLNKVDRCDIALQLTYRQTKILMTFIAFRTMKQTNA